MYLRKLYPRSALAKRWHHVLAEGRIPERLVPSNVSNLIDNTDVFIFDCDGVLWKGRERISNAHIAIKRLRNLGKAIYFVTNNSTKNRQCLKKKFDDLCFDVDYDEILSSVYAASLYLKMKGFDSKEHPKKVYVVGEIGICDELEMAGIECVGGPNHSDYEVDFSLNESMQVDHRIGAVVAGLDSRINYHKIQYAQLCINELNCEFIATNADELSHLTSNQKWPGGGATVGALRGCTGKDPVLVGKPSSFLINHILSNHKGTDPSRVCMVGDRLNTDILFGLNHHLTTLLTLSGVTDEKMLFSDKNETIPHYFMESIDDLIA